MKTILIFLAFIFTIPAYSVCNYGVRPGPVDSDFWEVSSSIAQQFVDQTKEAQEEIFEKYNGTAISDLSDQLINGFYTYHHEVFVNSLKEIDDFGVILIDESYLMNGGFIFDTKHSEIKTILAELLSDPNADKEKITPYVEMKVLSSLDEFDRVPATYWQLFILAAGTGDVVKVRTYTDNYDPADEYIYRYTEILNSEKFDINGQNQIGYTALMASAENGHIEVVKELLNKCANPKYMTFEGETALTLATTNGHSEIVELLKDL